MTDKTSADDTRSGDRFIPYDTRKSQKKQQQQQQKDENADLIPKLIANSAELLPEPEDPKFAEFIDRFADRRVILMGEASHGTSEFYRARAAITRRLVERHGFRLVCAEADWPDAAALNRYVRHWTRVEFPRAVFQRFPTWMWRNVEVDELLHWLRKFNTDRDASEQVGFYGLDLYNMNASITEVLNYLDKVDPEAAKLAKERYGCLQPWREEPANYGRASLLRGYAICEQGIVRQCKELLARELEYTAKEGNGQSFLDAAQNARLIQDAERYYRIMYYGGNESWNLRDTHMFETLEHLLRFYGEKSKAIVWAHNSHIGDARFTDMGDRRRQLNIGQLCRQRFGDQCALIGFGTNTGTVAAAEEWGDDMQIFPIRPSLPDSVERLCHDSGLPRFLLDLRPSERGGQQQTAEELRRRLLGRPRLERFIGVIYRPDTERWSHYSDTLLPKQFDAYIWFDHTEAVTPLGPQHAKPGMPDTYPFGL